MPMPMDPGAELPVSSRMVLLGLSALVLLAVVEAWVLAIGRLWAGKPLVPPRAGGPVRWGGWTVLLCFAVWQGATLVASAILDRRRAEDGELPLIDAIAAVSLINLALVIILPALLAMLRGATPADLGFRRGLIGPDVLLGVVAALFAMPLVYAVQFAAILIWSPTAHPLQEMLVQERSPWVMGLALVSAVVLAPAAEELLFRGILQGWLERRLHLRTPGDGAAPGADGDPRPAPEASEEFRDASSGVPVWSEGDRTADRIAIVFPAAFFAAVHAGQWPAPIPLFVLALGLGLLYRRTRGIVAPIAMHATFNGLSTVAMIVVVLVTPDPGPEPVVPRLPPEPTSAVAPGVEEGAPGGELMRPSHQNIESV